MMKYVDAHSPPYILLPNPKYNLPQSKTLPIPFKLPLITLNPKQTRSPSNPLWLCILSSSLLAWRPERGGAHLLAPHLFVVPSRPVMGVEGMESFQFLPVPRNFPWSQSPNILNI